MNYKLLWQLELEAHQATTLLLAKLEEENKLLKLKLEKQSTQNSQPTLGKIYYA